MQVWFQNRRAKFRKKENTKKGPGRPAHNAHPQTCSGEPISLEELERKDKDRREKKLLKQLEKQQKKLAAKGIHVDMDALKKDYDQQKAGQKGTHFDAQKVDEEIDVVGLDRSSDDLGGMNTDLDRSNDGDFDLEAVNNARKKLTAFSIESLLNSRVKQQQQQIRKQLQQQEETRERAEESSSPVSSSCPPSPLAPPHLLGHFQPHRASSPVLSNASSSSPPPTSAPTKASTPPSLPSPWHRPEGGMGLFPALKEPIKMSDEEGDEEEAVADVENAAATAADDEQEESKPSKKPQKPQVFKPSPTFPPLLRGPFPQPALNFLAAASAAANAVSAANALPSFLPGSPPPAPPQLANLTPFDLHSIGLGKLPPHSS